MLAAAQQEIRSKFEVGSRAQGYSAAAAAAAAAAACRPPLTRCWARCCFASVQTSRSVSNAEQQQQLLAEGSEAAEFISSSIVQAVANDRGSYGAVPCRQWVLARCSSAPSPLLQGWLCRAARSGQLAWSTTFARDLLAPHCACARLRDSSSPPTCAGCCRPVLPPRLQR